MLNYQRLTRQTGPHLSIAANSAHFGASKQYLVDHHDRKQQPNNKTQYNNSQICFDINSE